MLLELRDVSKRFGGVHAVTGLSMTVAPRTIHGLIGPNGAGKSTVFNLLTGVLPLSSGEIVFKGARVSGLRPSEICRRGIARTFQATTLFRESTVLDNVLLALQLHAATTFVSTLLGTAAYQDRERSARARARALLASLRLLDLADERAGNLPHRDQKALSLALALALVEIAARAGGKLDALFLDEGFGTLDASSLDEAMSVLESLAQAGRLVVVVSHIKAVAERIPTVLHITKTAAGSRAEFVSADERGKLVEAELEEHLLG